MATPGTSIMNQQHKSTAQTAHQIKKFTRNILELASKEYKINDEIWVDVTHVNHPHSFYTRPHAYQQHMELLEQPGERVRTLNLHETIVFHSKIQKKMIRGEVIGFTENFDSAHALAIDYGFHEQAIPITDIFKPLHDLPIPTIIFHCQLTECEPKGHDFDTKAIEAMIDYLGKQKCKLTIVGRGNGKHIVRINSSVGDVAFVMALTDYTSLGTGQAVNKLHAPMPAALYYKYHEPKVDDELYVQIIYGKTAENFFVATLPDYEMYKTIRDSFTHIMKSEKDIQPSELVEGKPVAIFSFDSYKYDRGVITKVIKPESEVLVQIVDTGETMKVKATHLMKAMTERFLEYQAIAIHCKCIEDQLTDYRIQKIMHKGYRLNIKIKEVGFCHERPYIVEIQDVSERCYN